MIIFNNVLYNAQVHAIEYCGYYILKFSIPSDRVIKDFNEVLLEFNSGYSIFLDNVQLPEHKMLELYGDTIKKIQLTTENNIRLEFECGFIINSSIDENPLVDIDWAIYVGSNRDEYILNSKGDLHMSANIKKLNE